ncbi:MAG: ferrous iron transport protein B [Ruminiclostridium sp.]|nr:ferrous iron transport protein B [Ruminiclostridium sp.]
MTLRDTDIGQTVRIEKVGGSGALRQHFLDMGVIPGAEITLMQFAPMGDPMELRLHGYELTLRLDDAAQIEVSPLSEKIQAQVRKPGEPVPEKKKTSGSTAKTMFASEHPGLGEGGRFHPKGSGDPLPKGTVIKMALVGNQNSGKTTLFNRLTGSNQHVGNFPGVTVDRKDGTIIGHPDCVITDLPGIYSMSPYTSEEIVSRNFVLDEKPHAVINIVDVTNIERNLYLTYQLLEMDIPVVVALNMMDELTANGGGVDVNKMESLLGVPVVPISAAKNEGIEELIEHAVHIAYYREKPEPRDLCDKRHKNGAVHRCMHSIEHLIEDHAEKAGLPLRFSASKAAEGDSLITERLGLDANEQETIGHIVRQTEAESGLDINAAIADMRFSFIFNLCERSVIKPRESREHIRSRKIDRILTGKYTAIPLFLIIMMLISFLTFNVIGAFLQELIELGVGSLTGLVDEALTRSHVNDVIHGLVVGGLFEGVGSVLSFMPVIVTMFFFLSILEDSGYIARVAFFMDKLLRKIGLSGRSIVPMLIGFGCSVPAVMATRTMPSERDRKMTILLTPFMSCSAKMPIYAFVIDALFPDIGWLIYIGLYVLGVVLAILAALLYKGTKFKGEAVPFVMELPNYRMPGVKNVAHLMWDKAKDFLQRAFTVILVASLAIWFLQSFDLSMKLTDDPGSSILAAAAGILSPVMAPIGLGDWQMLVALVTGFMAKESVVSTLEILYTGGIETVMTTLTAASFLVFSLLYTPCVAAIASIKRELGYRYAIFVVLWQCAIAWLAAFIVHFIGTLLGGA